MKFSLITGGGILSPDPIKTNPGGSGPEETPRRGKSRAHFLMNLGEEQNQQVTQRTLTTPGKAYTVMFQKKTDYVATTWFIYTLEKYNLSYL